MSLENGFGGIENTDARLEKARDENRKPSLEDNARDVFNITLAELEKKEIAKRKEALPKTLKGATMFAEAAMKKGNN